jgi:hypothetical protein
MRKYFVKEEVPYFRVYRKSPITDFQDTLVALCLYKEHAELVAEALNKNQKKAGTR